MVKSVIIAVLAIGSSAFANPRVTIPTSNVGIEFGPITPVNLNRCSTYVLDHYANPSREWVITGAELQTKFENASNPAIRSQLARAVDLCVTCDHLPVGDERFESQRKNCLTHIHKLFWTGRPDSPYIPQRNFVALLLNAVELNYLDPNSDVNYGMFRYAYKANGKNFFEMNLVSGFEEPARAIQFNKHVFQNYPGVFARYVSGLPEKKKSIVIKYLAGEILKGKQYDNEMNKVLAQSEEFKAEMRKNLSAFGNMLMANGNRLKEGLWLAHLYSSLRVEEIKAAIRAESELRNLRMKLLTGQAPSVLSEDTLRALGEKREGVEDVLARLEVTERTQQIMLAEHLNRIIIQVSTTNELDLANHALKMTELAKKIGPQAKVITLKPLLWSSQSSHYERTAREILEELTSNPNQKDVIEMIRLDVADVTSYTEQLNSFFNSLPYIDDVGRDGVDKALSDIITLINENAEVLDPEIRISLLSEFSNATLLSAEQKQRLLTLIKERYYGRLIHFMNKANIGGSKLVEGLERLR